MNILKADIVSRLCIIGSGTYTKLVKLGQTGALPGQTVVASPFPGRNGALQAQTVSIPVTTGAKCNLF